jgi:MFS family permease
VNAVRVQKKTVTTLMASGALSSLGYVAVVATVGLLASEMLGSDLWAGLPAAAGTVGTAVVAAPLAVLSRRRGRRRAIGLGYFAAAAGALLLVFAGQKAMFWLVIVAMALFGIGRASSLQARFAAADLAEERHRAGAIALVVWVGTVGAIAGPPIARWVNRIGADAGMADWVSPAFVGLVGVAGAGLVVSRWLRPDPLEYAGGVDPTVPFENPLRNVTRSWSVIWPNHHARLALVSMAVSQMAMVAVMTMTPLYMKDHGQADLSTLVISVHVLGMFGLSPLVGRWADRFGRILSLGLGATILGLGTLSAVIAGYAPGLVFIGLFMLGLGWSFALIAGSALLTESLPVDERVGAQGLADVAMSAFGAVAAFSSGLVKEMVGYHWLANFATIAAFLTVVAAASVSRRQPETVG